MILSRGTGPRSLIRTKIQRRLRRFVTFTQLPNGKVRCAAVSSYMSYGSPLAVGLPSKSLPYQDA